MKLMLVIFRLTVSRSRTLLRDRVRLQLTVKHSLNGIAVKQFVKPT
jgi:hypothetical protein